MDEELLKKNKAEQAAIHFLPGKEIKEIKAFGNGHIGDTYLLNLGDAKRVVLQRISTEVFREPEKLMDNVLMVTDYLRMKSEENGGDPKKETLHFLRTEEGNPFYKAEDGSYYRMYYYIIGIVCEKPGNARDFYESGVGFGNFQYLLSDFEAGKLYEVIPGFHDTAKRFQHFCEVVKEDKKGRTAKVEQEVRFVMNHEELAYEMGEKNLPIRVTHNDTKLNNVLLDEETGKAICVIDLDTVMPGLAGYDYGDAIRFGANTAAEDEKDLNLVSCDLELVDAFTAGFLKGCNGSLTEEEIRTLPLGAKTMTFECGMRFLTDYLEGDVYFKTDREGQNLDRCRTQLKLLQDMEEKWDKMNRIVEKYIH